MEGGGPAEGAGALYTPYPAGLVPPRGLPAAGLEFDALRELHEGREDALAADLARVRAELVSERALREEAQRAREEQLQHSMGRELQLQSALAAAQVRGEQLSGLVQDMRAELSEAKRERQQLSLRLDAAREEYLTLQRQAASVRDRCTELEARLAREKGIHEEEMLKVRKAASGASAVIAMSRGYGATSDPGYDAVVDTLFEVYSGNMDYASDPSRPIRKEDSDLILAKVASLARELDACRRECGTLRDERALVENRMRRAEEVLAQLGLSPSEGGAAAPQRAMILPSVQMLMDQLSAREAQLRSTEEILARTRSGLREAEEHLSARDREVRSLKMALRDMADSLRQVEGIRKTVQALMRSEAAQARGAPRGDRSARAPTQIPVRDSVEEVRASSRHRGTGDRDSPDPAAEKHRHSSRGSSTGSRAGSAARTSGRSNSSGTSTSAGRAPDSRRSEKGRKR